MKKQACAAWLVLFAVTLQSAEIEPWQSAKPGWSYRFPRDHRFHPEFKTEWWYFTGNLRDDSGRRLGYELTFFRDGVIPRDQQGRHQSRFVVADLKFAHLAITDVAGDRFVYTQKTSRGAFGEAGFGENGRVAWIENWMLEMTAEGNFRLRAAAPEGSLDLTLRPLKEPVLHGRDGISVKAAGTGNASHYYSLTRLATEGVVRVGDAAGRAVKGESWFDHEWATNQLGPNQIGWDWLSLQFEDGTELMLYQMRLAGGGIDPASHGTLVDRDGRTRPLERGEYGMEAEEIWVSDRTKARYPVGWKVRVPDLGLELTVRAAPAGAGAGLRAARLLGGCGGGDRPKP